MKFKEIVDELGNREKVPATEDSMVCLIEVMVKCQLGQYSMPRTCLKFLSLLWGQGARESGNARLGVSCGCLMIALNCASM